jgi:3-deoxy-D-manno-octulosonic-acid transferase
VLTPRHPERLDEVEATAREFGVVARRSALAEPGPDQERGDVGADIILVDTMGELAKIYAAADVVYVGGTFHRHGGQNFLEPCGLAKPTLTGPHLWNFREPAELLGGAGAMRIVETPEALGEALKEIVDDPSVGVAMGAKARDLLLRQRGAARRMVDRMNAIAVAAARRGRER